MLIYVNKKKEKYKKIKTLTFFLSILLLIIINITHFKKAIHTPTRNLTAYHSLKISQNWYNNAQTAALFTNKNSPLSIIVIPQSINKENFLTTATALHNTLTKNTTLSFTPEVKQTQLLQKTAEILSQTTPESTPQNLLITTDFNQVEPKIFTHKLYPSIINYKQAQKTLPLTPLTPLLNTAFPEPQLPNTPLDKEKHNLKTFAKDHATELKNLIFFQNRTAFSTRNLLLQNAKICLKNNHKTICRTSSELSFEKKLTQALSSFADTTPPEKLIFLTSEQPTTEQSPLKKDEGLRFSFGSKQAILLPESISTLSNPADAFYILKKHAGLNPDYTSPEMAFYKFKTMEINLNDDI